MNTFCYGWPAERLAVKIREALDHPPSSTH
jgi:hypothetical protein